MTLKQLNKRRQELYTLKQQDEATLNKLWDERFAANSTAILKAREEQDTKLTEERLKKEQENFLFMNYKDDKLILKGEVHVLDLKRINSITKKYQGVVISYRPAGTTREETIRIPTTDKKMQEKTYQKVKRLLTE